MTKEELRELRRSLGYTQPRMANLCGVPLRTYKYWELTEVTPSIAVRRLLKLLEYPEIRELMLDMALDDLEARANAN